MEGHAGAGPLNPTNDSRGIGCASASECCGAGPVEYHWLVPTEARLPALTGDARADRWREHRAAVRAELVDATLRAIEKYGPELSIDDVIKTAGVPRPKLYRFFEDKDTLFSAVGERVQAMVLERVVPRFNVAGTALELVRSAVAAYIDLVDEHPNLFRFLVGSSRLLAPVFDRVVTDDRAPTKGR